MRLFFINIMLSSSIVIFDSNKVFFIQIQMMRDFQMMRDENNKLSVFHYQ